MSETVLLTGATGFIAKHIAVKLLNAGYLVIGSVRSMSRGQEIRDAVRPKLDDDRDLDSRLRIIALDLTKDDGWTAAFEGVDILMHTASPFPLAQPKNADQLIRPAVEGTLRALSAAKAAGVKRVVLTSSLVAVAYGPLTGGRSQYDETDWTDASDLKNTPYVRSKTLAEQAAWTFIKQEAPEIGLTVINPGLVLGEPLDQNFGTSLKVIERIYTGKDPMLPNVGFATVDVLDVAEMHLRALQDPATIGERFAAVDSFLWFKDVAEALAQVYPERKFATRVAPDLILRMLSLIDRPLKAILPDLGRTWDVSNSKARSEMDMEFTPALDSVRRSAAFIAAAKPS